MKKITLKHYGYRDPEKVLDIALDFIRTKAQIKHVQLDVKNKAVTFQADPYDVEALRTTLRKKYGVTLITNLPRTHVFFVNFLAEEGFYDEYKRRAEAFLGAPIGGLLRTNDVTDWPMSEWISGSFYFIEPRHYEIDSRYKQAVTNFLNK